MEDNTLPNKNLSVFIIGGGIFGLSTAIVLGEKGYKVTLVEKHYDIMQEASLVNQNRIHLGYHYPRSLNTGKEALLGLQSFKEYFGDCINDTFDKYYCVAKQGSHVNSNEFVDFCDKINIPLEEKWPDEKLLNRDLIESCWLTPEPIFDFHRLKQMVIYRIKNNNNIRVIRNTKPQAINDLSDGGKEIILTNGYKVKAEIIINATYSGIPDFTTDQKVESIKGKFQLCAMPILESEKEVASPFGITVMDGPFCSLMPKGFNKNHFILYHVTHSVLQSHIGYHSVDWSPIDGFVELDIMELSKHIYPIIDKLKLRDTWITTRIVLPDQELDDARPTQIIEHNDRMVSIFSGKLTTCIDAGFAVNSYIEKKFS